MRKELEAAISKTESFNKQKMELATQASKLKNTLNYESKSDKAGKVAEAEGEIRAIQAKLQKGEKQEADGKQAKQAQEADLDVQGTSRGRGQ